MTPHTSGNVLIGDRVPRAARLRGPVRIDWWNDTTLPDGWWCLEDAAWHRSLADALTVLAAVPARLQLGDLHRERPWIARSRIYLQPEHGHVEQVGDLRVYRWPCVGARPFSGTLVHADEPMEWGPPPPTLRR